jgi:transcriptional regulator with XRE-family HTH domain
MAIPFGDAVRLWRGHRGLTQEALARRARVPRPNLSAIERGRRDVSLSTLRALAAALEVRPGVLVDGVPPQPPPAQWSRARLERVADAVVGRRPAHAGTERVMAEQLRCVVRHRARLASGRRGIPRRGVRASDAAWLALQAWCPPAVLRSLLERVEDRLQSP